MDLSACSGAHDPMTERKTLASLAPDSSQQWTLEQAAEVCRIVESIAPDYGAHVALTGGTLYKDGFRKDVDILFYTIRQRDAIDEQGLINALRELGFFIGKQYGWVLKANWRGKDVDFFFPEAYPANTQNSQGSY